MKKLEVLDLSYNDFEGTLDTCLGNLTSLWILDLSYNSLSGSIPAPSIASLASLEYLSLDGNKFEGLFSLNILANHSKLKVLQLGEMNSETFQVQTENPPWIASFQLEKLDISSCKVNLPTKTIPTFLSSQNGLRYIDLSGNNLVGMFPNWLLVNNPRLENVYLNDNSFTGPFKLPSDPNHHMDQIQVLDISNNEIHGELPNNMGFFFPHLEILDVSNNKFEGHIPVSIGEMSNLSTLDLGNNNLSGNIPEHILNGCIWLASLDVDNNQLNGTLLRWIGKPRLFILSASRNNFEGPITKDKCRLDLQFLDLSHNKLSGSLPSCFNMPSAQVINLQGNSLTGTIPKAIANSSSILAIDLSDNKFTGTIPESIYGLNYLKFLLLAGNQLQGQLSSHICKLRGLHILDFSRNNFTGSIPSCFNSIRFLEEQIDLSNKNSQVLPRRKAAIIYEIVTMPVEYMYRMEEVQFITKGLSYSYQGDVLKVMSALDLSSNQLTGEIPHQIGDLSGLHALNLSHNHLNGPIPKSFHKLESIESLDLSNNNLSGQIPLQLQDLHYLSVFIVCYNNLSGRAPDKGQFGTFDDSSYKGNPYLTWSNSNRRTAAPPPPPTPLDEGKKDDSVIDFTSFYWSFAASYVTVLLVLVTILWINPYWRRAWFYFMESCLLKCFGRFLEDAFY